MSTAAASTQNQSTPASTATSAARPANESVLPPAAAKEKKQKPEEAGAKVEVGGAADTASSCAAAASSSPPFSSSAIPGSKQKPNLLLASSSSSGSGFINYIVNNNQKQSTSTPKGGSTAADQSPTGGFVNINSSGSKNSVNNKPSSTPGIPSTIVQQTSGNQSKTKLIKEGDTLVRVRIKSGSGNGFHLPSSPTTPSGKGSKFGHESYSRGSILATKMAEHTTTVGTITGWPNNKDDYELGEVIGMSKDVNLIEWLLIISKTCFVFFVLIIVQVSERRQQSMQHIVYLGRRSVPLNVST